MSPKIEILSAIVALLCVFAGVLGVDDGKQELPLMEPLGSPGGANATGQPLMPPPTETTVQAEAGLGVDQEQMISAETTTYETKLDPTGEPDEQINSTNLKGEVVGTEEEAAVTDSAVTDPGVGAVTTVGPLLDDEETKMADEEDGHGDGGSHFRSTFDLFGIQQIRNAGSRIRIEKYKSTTTTTTPEPELDMELMDENDIAEEDPITEPMGEVATKKSPRGAEELPLKPIQDVNDGNYDANNGKNATDRHAADEDIAATTSAAAEAASVFFSIVFWGLLQTLG